jgi:hypothetical protein
MAFFQNPEVSRPHKARILDRRNPICIGGLSCLLPQRVRREFSSNCTRR